MHVQLPVATLEVSSPDSRLGLDIAARDSPFDHTVLRNRQNILPRVIGNHKEPVTKFVMVASRAPWARVNSQLPRSLGSKSFQGAAMPRFITLLTTTMVLSSDRSAGADWPGRASSAQPAGASQVEQARQAKETEARVQKQVDAAVQLDADRRKAAETESQ